MDICLLKKSKNSRWFILLALSEIMMNISNIMFISSALSLDFPFCVGSIHVCVGSRDKKVKCFGLNFSGELGIGNVNSVGDQPNELGANLPFINLGTDSGLDLVVDQLSCGGRHGCALLNNNRVKCWGNNNAGELGLGDTDNRGDNANEMGDNLPFVNLGTGIIPTQLGAGIWQTCIKFNNNKIKCFGDDFFGQLGYEAKQNLGWHPSQMGDNLPFVNFGVNIEVKSLHSSGVGYHHCIIINGASTVDQKMKCWGHNGHAQLGYGDTNHRGDERDEMGDNLPIIDLGSESRVKYVGVGRLVTCAITILDDLKCWGRNDFGQLGIGSTVNPINILGSSLATTPVDADENKKASVVGIGWLFICFLLNDYFSVKCVGDNQSGQLGQGDNVIRGNSPTNTADKFPAIDLGTGSLQIKYMGVGDHFTCVAFVDNRVKCFGSGNDGRLGSGNTTEIGNEPNEMGSNLPFVDLFEPTSAPTKHPTLVPTYVPTFSPSASPVISPSNSPTSTPTDVLIPYIPPKADCYMIPTKSACESELNSECGSCVYYSKKVRYRFRARVNFVMAKGLKFIDLDNYNANPPKTAFVDSVKLLLSSKLDGEERMLIYRLGQIIQVTGSDSGYADFEVNFVDNESNKIAARKYLESNPPLHDYTNELNYQLNRRLKTAGIQYIKGSIFINQLTITDLADGEGSCGCNQDTQSEGYKYKCFRIVMEVLIIFNIILFANY